MNSEENTQLEKVLQTLSSYTAVNNQDFQDMIEKAKQLENNRLKDMQRLLKQKEFPMEKSKFFKMDDLSFDVSDAIPTINLEQPMPGENFTNEAATKILKKAEAAIQEMLKKME